MTQLYCLLLYCLLSGWRVHNFTPLSIAKSQTLQWLGRSRCQMNSKVWITGTPRSATKQKATVWDKPQENHDTQAVNALQPTWVRIRKIFRVRTVFTLWTYGNWSSEFEVMDFPSEIRTIMLEYCIPPQISVHTIVEC